MLILKKGTERNIILLTEMKPLQNLRGPRTGSLPWVLRPTETIWMPKRVLIRFSAAHLSSSISRSPQCTVAAAEDDDCGDYLQLTEGRKGIKCCSPAIATHITGASVEKAPQPHARGWGGGGRGKRKGQVSLPYTVSCNSSRTSESPRATYCLPEHQENCAPLRYSLTLTSKAANFC